MGSLLDKSRLKTARFRQLPDFIIIGAQRAGTSSLFSYLEQHPQIKGSSRKEVHYFDNHYHEGEAWYRAFFPLSRSGASSYAVGEASPYYIVHPHAPGRIHQLIPDVKLIALLRNPTERAISHFFHEVALGNETVGLEQAIKSEEGRILNQWKRLKSDETFRSRIHQSFSYKQRGLYLDQVKRYHEFFPPQQLLILDSGALFRETRDTLARVLDFLELDTATDQIRLTPKNAGTYNEQVPGLLVEELNAYFEPYNQELFRYLGEEFDW